MKALLEATQGAEKSLVTSWNATTEAREIERMIVMAIQKLGYQIVNIDVSDQVKIVHGGKTGEETLAAVDVDMHLMVPMK